MSAWLPELFPTRVRATATAFVFNAPRLISWTGPLNLSRCLPYKIFLDAGATNSD
jgi:hypothetical protein